MAPSIVFVDHASNVGGSDLSLLDIATRWMALLHVTLMQRFPSATCCVTTGFRRL
jgi:hypothetical protein